MSEAEIEAERQAWSCVEQLLYSEGYGGFEEGVLPLVEARFHHHYGRTEQTTFTDEGDGLYKVEHLDTAPSLHEASSPAFGAAAVVKNVLSIDMSRTPLEVFATPSAADAVGRILQGLEAAVPIGELLDSFRKRYDLGTAKMEATPVRRSESDGRWLRERADARVNMVSSSGRCSHPQALKSQRGERIGLGIGIGIGILCPHLVDRSPLCMLLSCF